MIILKKAPAGTGAVHGFGQGLQATSVSVEAKNIAWLTAELT